MNALEAGLDSVRAAPSREGTLELIACRPATEERELLGEAYFDLEDGLAGDIWAERPSQRTGAPNPDAQVTVMSARAAALVSGGDDPDGWAQAGDQLYVDFDLSMEALPPGSRLAIGSALLEVSEQPHTGCAKFSARFGSDALRWINSPVGRELRMRGMNARVVRGGTVRAGDAVRRV